MVPELLVIPGRIMSKQNVISSVRGGKDHAEAPLLSAKRLQMARYATHIRALIDDQETTHQHNAIDGWFTKHSPIRRGETEKYNRSN